MDCRKSLMVGGLLVAGLVGCNKSATNSVDPYAVPVPKGFKAKAPAESKPVASRKGENKNEVSKVLDAKPESCVKIADLKAEIALDANRSPAERQTNAQGAKEIYRRAMQIDPKCMPAYLGMTRLCNGLGEYEQAILACDAGLARNPKEAALWYERGMCLGRMKRFDDGLMSLMRGAQAEPTNPVYTKSVGLMLARLGRGDEAVAWLGKVMPEADARYNVGQMMDHIGRGDEAARQMQLALRVNPEHEAARAALAGPQEHAAPVRQIAHQDGLAPAVVGPKIEVRESAPLPSRPSPVIPVISEQWERNPSLPGSLEGAAPKKPKAGVQMGFEPTPQ